MKGIALDKSSKPISRFLIPFAYEVHKGTFDQQVNLLLYDGWEVTDLKAKNNQLYENISSLLGDSLDSLKSNNTLGIALVNKNADDFYKQKYICKDIDIDITFSFRSIKMVLFRTGISFLILETDYNNLTDLNHVIAINNKIKHISHCDIFQIKTINKVIPINNIEFIDDSEISRLKADQSKSDSSYYSVIDTTNKNKLKYIRETDIPLQVGKVHNISNLRVTDSPTGKVLRYVYSDVKEDPFDFSNFLKDTLHKFEITTFFNQFKSKTTGDYMSSKADIFTSVCINHADEYTTQEFNKSFFRLRKGYNYRYVLSEKNTYNHNDEVYQPFDNIYWGVSREGVANITFNTSEFIRNEYTKRLDTYFYLYLLSLHQYYGLLLLTREISYIPNTVKSCYDDRQYRNLTNIRDKAIILYLKCFHDEVSHISHQSTYYQKLSRVLGTKRIEEEINDEINRITKVVEEIRYYKDQKKTQNIQTTLSIVGVVIAAFSLTSVFSSILAIWCQVATDNDKYEGFELINTAITIGVLLMFLIILSSTYLIIKHKKRDD